MPKSQVGIARWEIVSFSKRRNHFSGEDTSIPPAEHIRTLERVTVQGDEVHFDEAEGLKWQGKFAGDNELNLTLSIEGSTVTFERLLRRLSTPELTALKERALETHVQVARIGTPALRELPFNGLAPTPIMGWNSWNHFASSVNDKVVRDAADALVSTGLRDVGYVYVAIDDGWQGSRDQHGTLQPNAKFPDMKELADYVHSRGLKFGIYSSPGPFSCANYTGSHGYEDQYTTTSPAWGVDLLKYDWCSAAEIYTTQEEMRGRYQVMGAALEATRRPIVYSLCQYGLFDVGSWGRLVGGNLWRISGDSILGERWAAVDKRFDVNGNPQNSGPGGWNDPDMLLLGNGGLTLDEYRTHFTLWVILAAPLILGNNLSEMTPAIRDILLNREVIAIDQDPLGMQGRRVKKQGAVEIWSKPLANQEVAIALFNRGTRATDVEIRWSDFGLPPRAHVRILWEKKDLGLVDSLYRTTILPHGSALLKVAGS